MNQTKNEKLPLLLLVLGIAAAAVRGLLYLTAVDGKGMLIRGHFLGILLMILCAAAVLSVLYVIRLKGSDAFSDNFRPSTPAAVGCAVMAAGVLLTLLTGSMLFGGLLALEWGAYSLLDFFYSYTIAKEKGLKFFPVEVILYPAFHFAYGWGSLMGIINLPKFLKAEKEKKTTERQKGVKE